MDTLKGRSRLRGNNDYNIFSYNAENGNKTRSVDHLSLILDLKLNDLKASIVRSARNIANECSLDNIIDTFYLSSEKHFYYLGVEPPEKPVYFVNKYTFDFNLMDYGCNPEKPSMKMFLPVSEAYLGQHQVTTESEGWNCNSEIVWTSGRKTMFYYKSRLTHTTPLILLKKYTNTPMYKVPVRGRACEVILIDHRRNKDPEILFKGSFTECKDQFGRLNRKHRYSLTNVYIAVEGLIDRMARDNESV